MKKIIALILASVFVLSLAACGGSEEKKEETPAATEAVAKTEAEAPTAAPTIAPTEAPTEPPTEAANPVHVGDTVTTDTWNIELTDAYTTATLQSSESSTVLNAGDGYAFLALEFNVTCLNSTKPTIDKDAITDLVATVNGNTYEQWKYQYVSAQIWCRIKNTYLEADLPLHIFVYAMIPSSAMDESITVNLNLAGQPSVITIN